MREIRQMPERRTLTFFFRKNKERNRGQLSIGPSPPFKGQFVNPTEPFKEITIPLFIKRPGLWDAKKRGRGRRARRQRLRAMDGDEQVRRSHRVAVESVVAVGVPDRFCQGRAFPLNPNLNQAELKLERVERM